MSTGANPNCRNPSLQTFAVNPDLNPEHPDGVTPTQQLRIGSLLTIKGTNGDEKPTQHGMVRVHTYFIEQHKQHDTTRVACNITTTTTMNMTIDDLTCGY